MLHPWRISRRVSRALLVPLASVLLGIGTVPAADTKGTSMSYGEVKTFLEKYTKVVELTTSEGARVAVTPAWQGRVMTSTCSGLEGPSFGFVCYDFITAGKKNPHFNNYGGEERMWISPEGGQFSFWFKPGQTQNLSNWITPPVLNDMDWKTAPQSNASCVTMTASSEVSNASGTKFQLDIARDVRLLDGNDLQKLFGSAVGQKLQGPGMKMVAYETVNQLTNRGEPLNKAKGLVSIWLLSMLNSGPKSATIIPYKAGSEAELGPVVRTDYFGTIPADRLKVTPEAVLFRDDAEYRSKLGISQRRAKNILGAIDFETGVLTIAKFSMPDDPSKHMYPNSAWQMPQTEPFRGDVVNAYNDGPNDTGGRLGSFFELESVSPTQELKTGESLSHRSAILHVQADSKTLGSLAKEILGVDLDSVRQQFAIPAAAK